MLDVDGREFVCYNDKNTKGREMMDLHEKTEYALSLIADGDEVGVDLLYGCMGKVMLTVARGVLGDHYLAEDAVQESFLRIIKNIKQYKKGTNGYAWVCRIVRNTALNMAKSEGIRQAGALDEFTAVADSENTVEEATSRVLVESLMNSLHPPIVREMIYMKYFLDMTVREIAKEIGMSKSYVAKEIVKAEEAMRRSLGESWTK